MNYSVVRYWKNVTNAFESIYKGLSLTLRHLLKARKIQPIKSIASNNYFSDRTGIATVQYPHTHLPVPDNGRYQLHNEIDDCIVCDKCAVVCPVDCIRIEPVKSPEIIGKTSDGTSKRIHAAKFDIDMAKCCFCGLCTTVCPTECLTMTRTFDFSAFDLKEHNFSFAEMTQKEIETKKKIWEEHERNKQSSTGSEKTIKQARPVIIQNPPSA